MIEGHKEYDLWFWVKPHHSISDTVSVLLYHTCCSIPTESHRRPNIGEIQWFRHFIRLHWLGGKAYVISIEYRLYFIVQRYSERFHQKWEVPIGPNWTDSSSFPIWLFITKDFPFFEYLKWGASSRCRGFFTVPCGIRTKWPSGRPMRHGPCHFILYRYHLVPGRWLVHANIQQNVKIIKESCCSWEKLKFQSRITRN